MKLDKNLDHKSQQNKPTDPEIIRLLFENDNVFKVEVSDNDWVSELNEGLIKYEWFN